MGCSSSKQASAPDTHQATPSRPYMPPDKPKPQGAAVSSHEVPPSPSPPQPTQILHQQTTEPFIESARSLATSQPPNWPIIAQLEDVPIRVFVITHSRWTPSTDRHHCWTFVSSGLNTVNQPELVMTIRQRDGETRDEWPRMPILWARMVYLAARDSQVNLDVSTLCRIYHQNPVKIAFGTNNNNLVLESTAVDAWAEFSSFASIVHIPAHCDYVDLPQLPSPRHHAVLLTHRETQAALDFGLHRVLSRIAMATSWFPIAPWVDRDAEDVISVSENAGSIHVTAPVPFIRVPGITAVVQDSAKIVLRVPPNAAHVKMLQDAVAAVEPQNGVKLECGMAGDADSLLTWKSGNTGASYVAHTRDLKRTSMSYLMVAPMQASDSLIMVEDGYGMLLTDATWAVLRRAIAGKMGVSMAIHDRTAVKQVEFVLQWDWEGEKTQALQWSGAAS